MNAEERARLVERYRDGHRVVTWRFDDGGEYHVSIDDAGTARWAEGVGDNPRTTFVTTCPVWLKVSAGLLDGREAFRRDTPHARARLDGQGSGR